MDVTIADVSNRDAVEVVFFAQFRNLFGDFRNLVQGDDEVFRLEHLVNVAGGFGELLAQSPNPFIRFKFVDRAVGFRQVAELFHLAVRVVFAERFDRDDDVITAFVDMRHFHVQEFAGHAQGFIVHKFDARRVDAGFEDLIGQGKGFFIGLENADHIEGIRRHGTEFDRDFRNDAQRAFGTGKELFQQRPVELFLRRAPASRMSPVGVTTFRL